MKKNYNCQEINLLNTTLKLKTGVIINKNSARSILKGDCKDLEQGDLQIKINKK